MEYISIFNRQWQWQWQWQWQNNRILININFDSAIILILHGYNYMPISLKTVLTYFLLFSCFSSNLMAVETEAQRVEREKRAAIESQKNDRTVHGKLKSSLPSAVDKLKLSHAVLYQLKVA
ncbi:MAG: hypothetical protein ACI808_002511 [Paraglaciecola sp.]